MNEKLTATMPSAQPVTIPLHSNCNANMAAARSVAAHLLDRDILATLHHVDVQWNRRRITLELQWNESLELADREQRIMHGFAGQRLPVGQHLVGHGQHDLRRVIVLAHEE